MPTLLTSVAAAAGAALALTAAPLVVVATPDCTGATMTDSRGPTEGREQPCVFPFTFQKVQYTSCKSMDVPAAQRPFMTSGAETPSPTDFWCATVAQYGGNDASNPNRKKWGYCDCPATAPVAAPVQPPSAGTAAPVPTSAPVQYFTDGGLVPQNTPCQFPLRKGTTSYHACISFKNDPPRSPSGAVITPPQWSDSKKWCYAGSQVASKGSAVVYNTLSDDEKGKWGYCVDGAVQPSPPPSAPSVQATAQPTGWVPGPPTFKTSGGYEQEGTKCTLPFTIKATGKVFTTCAPYTPNAKNGPWMNPLNPPAQPILPTTNTTWCYTGTGKYDTANSQSRKAWGFCHEWADMPPSASPTTQTLTSVPTSATAQPTTAQPTTAQPTTAQPTTPQPTTKKPTQAPSKKGDTPEPTMEPTTAQPTTMEPTVEPTAAPSEIDITLPPTQPQLGATPAPTVQNTTTNTSAPVGSGASAGIVGSSIAMLATAAAVTVMVMA